MRVAAVWQVLMPVARDIVRVRITTNGEPGFEDMSISFAETFCGSLNTVLRQLEEMPWVATAELSKPSPVRDARDGSRRDVGRGASRFRDAPRPQFDVGMPAFVVRYRGA
jgi:hypothetical protein